MGTRADYWLGRGPEAEWLGSTAWDGYPEGIGADAAGGQMLSAETETTFRNAVARFLAGREDATLPAQGWPWPWNDSRTTDYAYAFDGGRVWCSRFGSAWCRPTEEPPEHDRDEWGRKIGGAEFPDMAARQNVTYGRRSGLIVIGPRGVSGDEP